MWFPSFAEVERCSSLKTRARAKWETCMTAAGLGRKPDTARPRDFISHGYGHHAETTVWGREKKSALAGYTLWHSAALRDVGQTTSETPRTCRCTLSLFFLQRSDSSLLLYPLRFSPCAAEVYTTIIQRHWTTLTILTTGALQRNGHSLPYFSAVPKILQSRREISGALRSRAYRVRLS